MNRLKAGPELDARIATEIMCWHLSSTGKTWRDSTDQHRDRVRNWRPSTDIADAFRVIAFMQKRGFFPGIECTSYGWRATMQTGWTSPYCKNQWPPSQTAALAICISAVQWIDETPRKGSGRDHSR